MGRPHKDFAGASERPALLARVLLQIEEAHPDGHVGVFADLFGSGCARAFAKVPSQRNMMQKWRRWTSGASVPARSEIIRILSIAERRGWLQPTGVEFDLSGVWTALLGDTSRPDFKRASWKRRRHIKTWAANLCRSRTTNDETAWASRLRFVAPCVNDLMEQVDERLGVAGNTASRQASLAEQPTATEALAMFRATMVEVACQMIEAMDRCPLSRGENGSDMSFVATPSTEREVEDKFLFEGSDRWPELLSHLGNDLRLLFRDAANEVRADGNPQRATGSARARVHALPFVDSDAE